MRRQVPQIDGERVGAQSREDARGERGWERDVEEGRGRGRGDGQEDGEPEGEGEGCAFFEGVRGVVVEVAQGRDVEFEGAGDFL